VSSFIFDILDILLVFFPWPKRKRARHEEWSGTVEAKKTLALSRHAYLVVFQTDDGQRKKVRLDRREDFDSYEEGRRYMKKAGEDLPNIKPAA